MKMRPMPNRYTKMTTDGGTVVVIRPSARGRNIFDARTTIKYSFLIMLSLIMINNNNNTEKIVGNIMFKAKHFL